MSDDESFVILGSCSPCNSLETKEILPNSFQTLQDSKLEKDASTENPKVANNINDPDSVNSESKDSSINEINTISNVTLIGSVNKKLTTDDNQEKESVKDSIGNVTACQMDRSSETERSVHVQSNASMNHSINSRASANISLAASFIMGEVDADVLKSNVYSQFPSLCSMESNAEDIIKLQNFMKEYIELKSTLAKVNATMKLFYEKTQQWREEMQRTEQQYKEQLQNCHTQIGVLRNENYELKREMDNKMEQIAIADEMKKKETIELIQLISEKAALVENMRAEIQKLNAENLTSFEYIPRHEDDPKNDCDDKPYSKQMLAVKQMERKLSELLAENLELKDMQKVYIDEINCLKVNLISAEELIKKSQRDIEFLKSNDSENAKRFREHENERIAMREDIALLHQQVDVYFKDFQTERLARETLAGEKEQLLQDLRNLQRNNQQLIEAQQRRLEGAVPKKSSNADIQNSPTTSNDNSRTNTPNEQLPPSNNTKSANCPICNESVALAVLQIHVNDCLDKA